MIYLVCFCLSARKQTIVKEWNKSSWRAHLWAKHISPMSDKSMMLIKCHLDFQTFCLLHRLHLTPPPPLPSAFHFLIDLQVILAVFRLFRVIIAVFLTSLSLHITQFPLPKTGNQTIVTYLGFFVQCTAQVSSIIPCNIHPYAVYIRI